LAMIRISQAPSDIQAQFKMIMQVHDELIFEVQEAHVPAVCDFIKEAMEKAFSLEVPLEVAIGVGNNWDEAH